MAGKRTPEIETEILARVAKGESIRKICGPDRDDFLPSVVAWYEWLDSDADLVKRYTRASDLRSDMMFEGMIEIADDATNDFMATEKGEAFNAEHVQRSKLRIETRKWMLAKMQPKKYGDKLDLNHNGSLTVTLESDADKL